MDKTTKLNLWIGFSGFLLALVSLSWQVTEKYYSSKERLEATLTVMAKGGMKIEVVNSGAINAYVEVPYINIGTENGKGYGFFFNEGNEKARLLAPGDKASFVCRVFEDWQVSGFIAPQRVRKAVVVVSSAKEFVRIFNLKSKKWKERLPFLYRYSTKNYDKIDVSYVHRKVDFKPITINGVTHFGSEFHFK